jgi:hypothetical protein
MMSWDHELEDFKSKIDLREYAAGQGYTLDRRESWRGSAVMRNGGDKVVIKVNSNGHHIYFSVRDERDNGTIVDFVQFRKRLSLGEVRKELRPWIGRAPTSLPRFAKLEKTGKDRLRVETEYRRMKEARRHAYLEEERAVPAGILQSDRFAGMVREDIHGNAVFPHFDQLGLCGYELKNRNFTGFAPGGEKGLWSSHEKEGDARLVFAESAIDALSHAALFRDDDARYKSIGGQVNPRQPNLIHAEVLRMRPGSEIIAAMDADDAGRAFADLVRLEVVRAAHPDLCFRIHVPEREGDDWNQVLQDSRLPFPVARSD